MVTEWGYCSLELGDGAPSKEDSNALRSEVKVGNFERLNALKEGKIIFVPTEVDCGDFVDVYPE